ncbi:MAG: DNA repair protein RadA [Pseudomonadota bacterium]
MAKPKTRYVCADCGAVHTKWSGQCGDCGAWNTLSEAAPEPPGRAGRLGGYAGVAGLAEVQSLDGIEADESPRVPTGIGEVDRVLGGGLVPGGVVLIGGDPGIGKSTLLLQVQDAVARSMRALYVSGEESLQQIALRARRLGLDPARLRCVAETCVERILATVAEEKPQLVVIDSIQTIFSEQLQSAPGSVSQVRDSAAALVRHAKATRTTVLLVGHVTKEGGIAGPRVLEHMVDAVLYFEGDGGGRYRVIRALKNRFGAVNELGIFAMGDSGLKPVSNPSAIFLSGHDGAPGSTVTVMREGTRPLLVEVQALVAESSLANPRRVGVGMENSRLAMLLAVLSRHAGLVMHDQDVFVNAVGGLRLSETAADLPAVAAMVSSFRDRALPRKTVAFGEVGLAGEIRPVFNGEDRLKEAAKHGFERAVVPKGNLAGASVGGIEIVGVRSVEQALAALFDG